MGGRLSRLVTRSRSSSPSAPAHFTLRQMIAAAAAVGVIVTFARAAASAVPTVMTAIVDGTNQNLKAKVDATGALKVSDGSGPMTVDGAVAMSVPAQPFSFVGAGTRAVQIVLRNTSSAPIVLAITHFSASTFDDGGDVILVIQDGGATCENFAGLFDVRWTSLIQPNDKVEATFPSPLVVTIQPGQMLCANGSISGGYRTNVVGFTV